MPPTKDKELIEIKPIYWGNRKWVAYSDYNKALSSANKQIEKLRKEIMISGGDALMKIQEKVGLKQQLKSQSDEMIMGIDEELKRCRDKKHLNMYDKKYRVYVGGLTEAKNIIRRLKQTHKEQ